VFIPHGDSKATSDIACHSHDPWVRVTEERENLLHVSEIASIWILVTKSTTEQYKPREYSLEGNWGAKITTPASYLLNEVGLFIFILKGKSSYDKF